MSAREECTGRCDVTNTDRSPRTLPRAQKPLRKTKHKPVSTAHALQGKHTRARYKKHGVPNAWRRICSGCRHRCPVGTKKPRTTTMRSGCASRLSAPIPFHPLARSSEDTVKKLVAIRKRDCRATLELNHRGPWFDKGHNTGHPKMDRTRAHPGKPKCIAATHDTASWRTLEFRGFGCGVRCVRGQRSSGKVRS